MSLKDDSVDRDFFARADPKCIADLDFRKSNLFVGPISADSTGQHGVEMERASLANCLDP